MNKLDLSKSSMEIGKPIIGRLVTMLFGWIVAYGVLSTGIETYKKVLDSKNELVFCT